jgi:hypothetical protein
MNGESCNDVNYLFFVADWVDPPVVDDEVKLTDHFLSVSHFVVLLETVSHHGD